MFREIINRDQAKTIFGIILAATILLIPAFLNGFPFIFPDSGDYLVFTPRIYRSPYYALFIFLFHMNRWIWLPIIAQSLITAHLIYLLVCVNSGRKRLITTVLISTLLLLSSSPFFIGFIMADIFTPIMIIVLYLVCFRFQNFGRINQIYLLALLSLSIAAHVSNLTIALALLPVLAILLLWCSHWKLPGVKPMIFLAPPIVLAASAVLLFNGTIFKTVALTPAGPDFLLANMIQYGPARTYLESACPKAAYKVCAEVPHLPQTADELLWSSGIFDRLGGFAAMKDESKAIVSATIRDYPRQVFEMVVNNFFAGLRLHEPAAEFFSEYQTRSMDGLLHGKFGRKTLTEYRSSAEMSNTIPHKAIKAFDDIGVPIMFFATIFLGFRQARKGDFRGASFAGFIIFAIW